MWEEELLQKTGEVNIVLLFFVCFSFLQHTYARVFNFYYFIY